MDIDLFSIVQLGLIICIIYMIRQDKPSAPIYVPRQTTAPPDSDLPQINRAASRNSLQSRIRNQIRQYSQDVKRICITGGPCAGKTSSMAKLAERMPEHNYKVYAVPEAATLLRKGGAMLDLSFFNTSAKIQFQLTLIRLQMALEDAYTNIAEAIGGKALVICDRGVMDGCAYVSKDMWQAILDELGVPIIHLRDVRYDAVIHMITAALGAKQYYSLKDNDARYESLDAAQQVDWRLRDAWTGHPKVYIIENNTVKSFEEKIQKVISTVTGILGLRPPHQHQYKFIVCGDRGEPIPQPPSFLPKQELEHQDTFIIEQETNSLVRLSRRGHAGNYTYTINSEVPQSDGTTKKFSNIITSREYLTLIKQRDPSRKVIKRRLTCFMYGVDYCVLDTYLNVGNTITILRIESELEMNQLRIAPFIKITYIITPEDTKYSTVEMAKNDWEPYQLEIQKNVPCCNSRVCQTSS